jgi:hypothetical protein
MVRHLVARGRLGLDIFFQAPSYQGKPANASVLSGGPIFEGFGVRRTAHRRGLNGGPSCSPWSIRSGYFFSGFQQTHPLAGVVGVGRKSQVIGTSPQAGRWSQAPEQAVGYTVSVPLFGEQHVINYFFLLLFVKL